MSEPLPKSLLDDFFNGKATALQRQWLAEWLRQPENQTTFYLAIDEWEHQHPHTRRRGRGPEPVSGGIAGTRAGFRQVPGDACSPPERPPHLSCLWAASVALPLLAGGWFGREVIFYETHRTTYGETRAFTLPDGSTVALNANSVLRVPGSGFGDRTREVRHLPDHRRFVVKTGSEFSVEVLGTEFVLYARDTRRRVMLNRGRVNVTYHPDKQVLMRPGDWVALGAAKPQIQPTLPPGNSTIFPVLPVYTSLRILYPNKIAFSRLLLIGLHPLPRPIKRGLT